MGLLDALEDLSETVTNVGEGIVDILDHSYDLAEQAAEWLDEIGAVEKFLATAHSPILQGGQRAIGGMRRTTGSGEPEDGAQFEHGARRFADAAQVLAGAGPTDEWTGRASDAYGADNGRQKGRASVMAATDRRIHEVIAKEAAQIEFHRGKLDDQSNWLADVGRATFALALVPGIGLAMKTVAEMQAVIAAVGASAAELQVLSGEVSANAKAIEELTRTYQTVVDGTPRASIQGPGSPPPPPGGGTDTPPATNPPSRRGGPEANGPRTGSTGTGSGAGGGASGSGGSPAVPTQSAQAMPKIPQTPPSATPRTSGGSPSGGGGAPAGGGGSPSSPSGSPAASGTGGVPTDLAQTLQSAVQRALDQQDADKAKDEDEEDEKDKDKDGVPDAEEDADGDGVPDAEDDDADGDGVPDTAMVARAGPNGLVGGRAPVHIEFDVDPERLSVPMTVTLDRDRPIVVPPTTTT